MSILLKLRSLSAVWILVVPFALLSSCASQDASHEPAKQVAPQPAKEKAAPTPAAPRRISAERAAALALKVVRGQASEAERAQLDEWLATQEEPPSPSPQN
jgi:hypothetical protein